MRTVKSHNLRHWIGDVAHTAETHTQAVPFRLSQQERAARQVCARACMGCTRHRRGSFDWHLPSRFALMYVWPRKCGKPWAGEGHLEETAQEAGREAPALWTEAHDGGRPLRRVRERPHHRCARLSLLCHRIDRNGDGQIDYMEFELALQRLGLGLSEQQVSSIAAQRGRDI
eukprot:COSAG01_NODE_16994_length_1187_cov_0.791360_2_plen_172_part_00